ncbi:MAG: Uncharacterised protein [Halieaceae bacterium]|nr:MAG: Uncharacterised protein [Halieaceae bacterium]
MLERRVKICHQFADAIDRHLVRSHHNAIGALVGHQHRLFIGFSTLTLPGLLKRVQHADHVLGHPVLEADDFRGLHRRAVHALNNVDDPANIGSNIGDDDGVAGCVGRHMRLLRHQRTKDRNQFGRRDIVEADDLCHVFVVTNRRLIFHDGHRR